MKDASREKSDSTYRNVSTNKSRETDNDCGHWGLRDERSHLVGVLPGGEKMFWSLMEVDSSVNVLNASTLSL